MDKRKVIKIMKSMTFIQTWLRAIGCLACILGMQALAAMAQNAGSSAPPKPRKIIDYGGGGWKDAQVEEPCVLVNPKDPGKLIMFFGGYTRGVTNGSIGKAWADVSAPFAWHEDANNPLLKSDPKKCIGGRDPSPGFSDL